MDPLVMTNFITSFNHPVKGTWRKFTRTSVMREHKVGRTYNTLFVYCIEHPKKPTVYSFFVKKRFSPWVQSTKTFSTLVEAMNEAMAASSSKRTQMPTKSK